MKVELSISRRAECGLPKRFFTDVAEEALRLSLLLKESATIAIGVAFVSNEEIGELNRVYRGKSAPTDVLSFAEFRKKAEVRATDGRIELGDLVLSPSFIRKAAIEDGVPFEKEMAFIFSHGIFHLLGFRHSPRMFSMQDEIASMYGLPLKSNKTKKL
jgi:probable rRNA maturation factor